MFEELNWEKYEDELKSLTTYDDLIIPQEGIYTVNLINIINTYTKKGPYLVKFYFGVDNEPGTLEALFFVKIEEEGPHKVNAIKLKKFVEDLYDHSVKTKDLFDESSELFNDIVKNAKNTLFELEITFNGKFANYKIV